MKGRTNISVKECCTPFRKDELYEDAFNPANLTQGPAGGMGATNGHSDLDIDGWYTPLSDLNFTQDYKNLICPRNLKMASEKITQLLDGTHPEGKRILVPDSTIRENIVATFRKGNNYDPAKVLEEAINEIVQYIQDEYRTIIKNNSYSVWNNNMGEGNAHGLMPHPKIKLREKTLNQIIVGGRY
jgi:hypothetical protein